MRRKEGYMIMVGRRQTGVVGRKANGTNQGVFEARLQAGSRPMQGPSCHNPFKPERLEPRRGGGGGEVVRLHHLLMQIIILVW